MTLRTCLRAMTAVGLTTALLATAPVAGQQESAAAVDLGTVTGIVRLDDEPLASAVVTLSGARLSPARAVVTDSQGVFTFANLPSGEFALALRRPPYVVAAVGGVAWMGDEIPISVTARQPVTLSLVLARGGAIEGVVRDPFGQPLPGATVSVFRKRRDASVSRVPPVAAVTTDGRGRYRAYGLPPAEYVVQVSAATSSGSVAIELVDDAEFRSLERATPGSRVVGAAKPQPETVQYLPTYYGGTAFENDAVGVTVAAGQEQTGTDIQLGLSQTVTLRGFVALSDGRPAPVSRVSLLPAEPGSGPIGTTVVTVDGDGGFTKEGVAPGRYRLVARMVSSGDASSIERGSVDIQVPGSDASNIRLVLGKPVSLRGRLILDGVDPARQGPILQSARVVLRRAAGGIVVSSLDVVEARVRETGAFEFQDVLTGDYAITLAFAETPDVDPPGLEFMQIGGATLADGIVPVSGSSDDVLDVHVSTRQSELSGTVVGWPRGIAGSLSVLVFPDDADWRRSSHRVRMVQVQESGSYRVTGLASGAYRVAVVSGVDLSAVFTLSSVEEATAFATPVRLGQGEVRVFDLRVDSPPQQ
jgi:hypothetical protein